MKKSGVVFGALLALGLALYLGWFARGPSVSGQPEPALSEEAPAAVSSPLPAITAEPEAPHSQMTPPHPQPTPPVSKDGLSPGPGSGAPSGAGPLLSGAAAPPSVDQVRADAARDPEAPSAAMLRFSIALEQKMEVALQSEKAALPLFDEVGGCAANEGKALLAEAARVACLTSASQLADKYPDLRPKYENLETRTDPRVVKLKKLMDVK